MVTLECNEFDSQVHSSIRSSICRPEAQFVAWFKARFIARFGDHCADSQISYRSHPTLLTCFGENRRTMHTLALQMQLTPYSTTHAMSKQMGESKAEFTECTQVSPYQEQG